MPRPRKRKSLAWAKNFDISSMRPLAAQRVLHQVRHLGQALQELPAAGGGERAAQAPEVQREQGQGHELRREGLGGRHADLGAGVGEEGARRFARQHRALHVADRDRQRALLLGLAEGGQRVRGLPALADGHGQRLGAHDRVAVAELAAVVHLGRHLRHLLEQVLAHQRRVPARPAGQEQHALRAPQLLGRRPQLLQVDFALLQADAPEQRVPHRARLLVDLLEHEVAVAALLRLHGVPGDPRGAALHGACRRRR